MDNQPSSPLPLSVDQLTEDKSQIIEEQKYDFDQELDRRGTDSMKFDSIEQYFPLYQQIYNETDPLWVADTDFAVAPEIIQEMKKRLDHPVLGYPTYAQDTQSLCECVQKWFSRRHAMNFETKDVTYSIGVVNMIAALIWTLSEPGEGPVYYQFPRKILQNKRIPIPLTLEIKEDVFEIDFDKLEELMAIKSNKILLLANPHNPTGRVWTSTEMRRICELCVKYNIFLISDEIFADLTFHPFSHVSPLSLNYPPIEQLCAVAATPSKCFGMPGLTSSIVIIKNSEIRQKYTLQVQSWGMYFLNIFSMVGIKAAYTHGEKWIGELKQYLQENTLLVKEFFQQNEPRVQVLENQAAFLMLLKFDKLGLTFQDLEKRIANQKLLPSFMTAFYYPFQQNPEFRMNIGCPKKVLQRALNKILAALEGLNEKNEN